MNSLRHQTRGREEIEKAGKLRGSSRNSRNSPGPRSLWATVFMFPSTLTGGQGLYVGALAYLQDLYSVVIATLSENFCLKTKGTISNNGCRHIHLASWPRAAQGPVARAPGAITVFWAPSLFPELPDTQSLHKGHFHTRLLFSTIERLYSEEWRLTGAPPGSGNPRGLEGLVNTIV